MSIIFTAALLGFAQVPVSPDVACILDALPAADRSQIARDFGEGRWEPVLDRVDAILDGCAIERGWSSGQVVTFAGWASAIILRDDAAEQLRLASVPVGSIDQWFASQEAEVRTNMDRDQVVLDALIQVLQDQGTPKAVLDAQSETIATYFDARIMIERAALGLPLI